MQTHRPHEPEILGPFEYCFPPSAKGARLARRVLALWLREQPVRDETVHDLLVACSELCANAISHADAERVQLGARVDGDEVVLEVHDDGRGFTLAATGRDTPNLHAEHGRGLHLVAALTDHIEVRCEDGATIVRCYKGGVIDLTGSDES